MKILLHKQFKKQFKKLKKGEQKKFEEKIDIFIKDQFNQVLNNHSLHGKFKDCRSINVTGNLRAIYEEKDRNIFLFIAIDTHSNLYS